MQKLLNKDTSFRHKAAFGKRIEHYIIGLMLKKGLDCYIPMVDDDKIDVVIKKQNGEFVEVQIKAMSKDNQVQNMANFTALVHPQIRKNYYFVFYSEYFDKYWILSSEEFINKSTEVKTGKNKGKRCIKFNYVKNKKPETLDALEQFCHSDFKPFF